MPTTSHAWYNVAQRSKGALCIPNDLGVLLDELPVPLQEPAGFFHLTLGKAEFPLHDIKGNYYWGTLRKV